MDFKTNLKTDARNLFSLSALEKGRVTTSFPDPRAILEFKELDTVIAHSLRRPNLLRTQTLEGSPLPSPKHENRTMLDEDLLKRLIQHRAQVPLSSRIIRKRDP